MGAAAIVLVCRRLHNGCGVLELEKDGHATRKCKLAGVTDYAMGMQHVGEVGVEMGQWEMELHAGWACAGRGLGLHVGASLLCWELSKPGPALLSQKKACWAQN